MKKTNVNATNIKEIANAIGMEIDDSIAQEAVKMTDNQVTQACNVLRDNRDTVMEERMNFDSKEYHECIDELQSKDMGVCMGTIAVNPMTGAQLVVGSEEIEEKEIAESDEHEEEVDLIELFEKEKHEITLEKCKRVFIDTYGVTDEHEQQVLFDAIMDVDNAKYDVLPQTIKNCVTMAVPQQFKEDQDTIDQFTKYMLNNMKTDIVADKAIVDMNSIITESMDGASKVMDEVLEYNRELLEVNVLKQAQEIEDQGFKQKAEQLRRCADSFNSTYTYSKLRRKWSALKLRNKKVTLKEYLEHETKFYQQYVSRFNNRYKTTELSINSVGLVLPALNRLLPDQNEKDLMKFVILFCMVSNLLNQKNWEDHIFMYYTIQNIVSLDAVKDKETGMAKEILDNIRLVIKEVIK